MKKSFSWLPLLWLKVLSVLVMIATLSARILYSEWKTTHTTYIIKQFGNERSSNLWIVDSRVLSWDCENDHAQELDQVFRSAEVFWKACWWNYSVLSTQYIYIYSLSCYNYDYRRYYTWFFVVEDSVCENLSDPFLQLSVFSDIAIIGIVVFHHVLHKAGKRKSVATEILDHQNIK